MKSFLINCFVFLFYFSILPAVFYELKKLTNPGKFAASFIRFKNTKKYNYSVNQELYQWLIMGYLAFVFFGFFSSQWEAFLLIFIFGFISNRNKATVFLGSLLKLSTLIFIILNKYHLHFDLSAFVVWIFKGEPVY